MFKRMLQATSILSADRTSSEERPAPAGKPVSPIGERTGSENPPKAADTKLSSFEEIYQKSTCKPLTATAEWHVLKVSEMLNSDHLRSLSPAGRHSALMMALEAAGVAVEDILQDAVQRQRVLNEYEEGQHRRLREFEKVKLSENDHLSAEMENICGQYRARIAVGVHDIEREMNAFGEWKDQKEREQRRIAEAASYCVSADSGPSSDVSISRMLEKNASAGGRLRESA